MTYSELVIVYVNADLLIADAIRTSLRARGINASLLPEKKLAKSTICTDCCVSDCQAVLFLNPRSGETSQIIDVSVKNIKGLTNHFVRICTVNHSAVENDKLDELRKSFDSLAHASSVKTIVLKEQLDVRPTIGIVPPRRMEKPTLPSLCSVADEIEREAQDHGATLPRNCRTRFFARCAMITYSRWFPTLVAGIIFTLVFLGWLANFYELLPNSNKPTPPELTVEYPGNYNLPAVLDPQTVSPLVGATITIRSDVPPEGCSSYYFAVYPNNFVQFESFVTPENQRPFVIQADTAGPMSVFAIHLRDGVITSPHEIAEAWKSDVAYPSDMTLSPKIRLHWDNTLSSSVEWTATVGDRGSAQRGTLNALDQWAQQVAAHLHGLHPRVAFSGWTFLVRPSKDGQTPASESPPESTPPNSSE